MAAPSIASSLHKEPELLRQEATRVQQTLEALYRSHYTTIIENYECMTFIQERGTEFQADLTALQEEVGGLKEACGPFTAGAQAIVGDLKRNRQTFQHHLQLVELLEVPQVMDACLRNGLYDEAVEVVAFANTLERRHLRSLEQADPYSNSKSRSMFDEGGRGKHTVVIAGLVQELRVLQRQLRERLVYQLRLPIQLPRCLQIISCLRKLDGLALDARSQGPRKRQLSLSAAPATVNRGRIGAAHDVSGHDELEKELQTEFLDARDAWLQSELEQGRSGASGARGHGVGVADLMAMIEANRTHWFEITTQFRAIFLDDGLEASGSSSSTHSSSTSLLRGQDGAGGSKVLSAWLLRRLALFLGELEDKLAHVTEGAVLADVMEQCLFFAASMGRIGGDFRASLGPVFSQAILAMADAHWSASRVELEALLERCAREGTMLRAQPRPHRQSGSGSHPYPMCYYAPGSTGPNQHDGRDTAHHSAQPDPDTSTSESDFPAPPSSILAFPPLAQFTNLVLVSYNQLRQCTPWSLVDDLQALLVTRLREVAGLLVKHEEQLQQLIREHDEEAQAPLSAVTGQYRDLRREARDVVFPYVIRCFGRMVTGGGGGGVGKMTREGRQIEELDTEMRKVWSAQSPEPC
ncbi:Dor1-like protein [Nannochloropsis gaditana]|uniref:Conserved oligomeric Golgi complex subunit 8 n=4 Tax=Nannochloropsis gaditana TaxID=72520 RepID=W7TN52_9STRA|nr:Dor1-like protein [Nannochloropsis gaditana]